MEEEAKETFLRKIKEYNDKKEYYEHYVQLNEEQLLIITWKNSWDYRIKMLENE